MRKIQIGLTLVAVLAFSVAAVASASAMEWLVKGAAVAGAVAVDSSTEAGNLLLLEDTGTGVDVLCEGTDSGSVNTAGKDEETVVTPSNCVVDTGAATCVKLLSVKAVNLPWTTQLEAGIRDKITKGTGGKPGWAVECEGPFKIKVTDTCVTETGSTAMANEANGTVDATFDVHAGNEAECSVGGAKTGLVIGLVFLLTVNGEALAVN